MRNLNLQRLEVHQPKNLNSATFFCARPISSLHLQTQQESANADRHEAYFFSGGVLYCLLGDEDHLEEVQRLTDLYDAEKPSVVSMAYLSQSSAICLAMDNGDVLTTESGRLERTGEVQGGLKTMQWSPDQGLVVLVSGEDKAIVMTADFDPIAETDLQQDSFGEKQFIVVGWGKKETQFHGSAGKAAAKTQVQATTPKFDWDDGKPRVTWRGDGNLFAVSVISKETGSRQIRVLSREGVLQFTSEPTPGLEQALDWKPSGSLLASSQRLPNKHLIAFFEKNGLRHGEIILPFAPDQVKVREVSWSKDSSVLAVWCESLAPEAGLSCLQLWAASNFTWQLKKTLHFPPELPLLGFTWDSEDQSSLLVMQKGLTYAHYCWSWSIDHSRGNTTEDPSCVAVIDGKNVNVTNLREAVVPPPMCAYTLPVTASPTQVFFGPSDIKDKSAAVGTNPSDVCVVLNDNTLAVFSSDKAVGDCKNKLGFAEIGTRHQLVVVYSVDWGVELPQPCKHVPLALHHWLWLQPDLLVCMSASLQGGQLLCFLHLEDAKATVRQVVEVQGTVVCMRAIPGGRQVLLLHQGGRLQLLGVDSEKLEPQANKLPPALPHHTRKFEVFEVDGEMKVVALSIQNRLYIGTVEFIKDCSSFFIHSEFLLITTFQHKLLCIPRTKKAFDALLSKGEAMKMENVDRLLEHGAVLVAAVPYNTRVVLQMPRGNLETIQPRVMAIHYIRGLLDKGNYAEAFDLMRRQRINLNLLYDHNPATFLTNIQQFVLQIKNPTFLSLFLSDLMEADVTQSMYAGQYADRRLSIPEAGVSKLDLVCRKMRQTLLAEGRERLLLPIITTFVKESIPDIGAALQLIRQTKVEEQQKQLLVSSEEALRFLLYLVDVNELYDVALGLYDFDLVMMVASRSQKDPKEYLPFLNKLRQLEINYQRFSIDKHLRKFASALKHLCQCGEEHAEETMSFVKTHDLYSTALCIFPKSHSRYKPLCQAYGESLYSKKRFEEAGMMFSRSESFSQAVEAFKKDGAWQSAVMLVPKLHLSEEAQIAFFKELVHELREKKMYVAASEVYWELLHDHDERVMCLCLARCWEHALRASITTPHLTESVVRAGVLEHLESLSAVVNESQEALLKYSQRLVVVRETKQALKRLEDEHTAPECDMYSDTSSIQGSTTSKGSTTASRSSGKSYRSSKSKRKHERKLLSLKEGSPFEDLALVRTLHNLYTRIYVLPGEVRSLCMALLHFGLDTRAAQLQADLETLLKHMAKSEELIWTPQLAQDRAAALTAFGPDSTSNSIAAVTQNNLSVITAAVELEPHLCLPPARPPNTWKLHVL